MDDEVAAVLWTLSTAFVAVADLAMNAFGQEPPRA